MWAQLINVILGLLVTASPGIWHFEKMEADNSHITGPLIITFAVIALWEVNRNVRYFNVLAGAWLTGGSLILGFQSNVMIINIAIGVVLIALSLIKGKIKNSYGGGWRSLVQKNPVHMRP